MSYENTYTVRHEVEFTHDHIPYVIPVRFEIEATVDDEGEVYDHRVTGFEHDEDRYGCIPADVRRHIIDRAQTDRDLFDALEEAVAEDDDAPRPRSDRAEHGTHYVGGAL